jgi:ATP-binding cassette, subfamily F, member 3
MSIVRLEGLTREVGDFVILDHVDAVVTAGDRIGLVGPNGAGKTTLLRLLVGLDEPDVGQVHRKRGLTIAMLPQEAHVDSSFTEAPSLRLAVRSGAARVVELERILREMEISGRVTEPDYEHLQHEFAVRDGYSLDQRVEAALSGLGFERSEWDRPPTNLSGGEQTRGNLARLLMADPELLLLDEPTNHLDLGALEWLEDHLGRRHGSLLVASHDRAFLDAVVTRVWELRDRKLTPFRGNYSAYARQREERDLRAAQEAEDRVGQIQRERELVQLYRHQRKFSKMHEHEARLEALEPPEQRRADARLRLPTEALAGGAPARSYESVVRAEGLVVGYPSDSRPGAGATAGGAADGGADGDRETAAGRARAAALRSNRGNGSGAASTKVAVARVPWLELHRGDRVGIVGPNGAGKTTLLRTIGGELAPQDGSLDLGKNVQLAYLAQLRDAPIPGTTVLDAVLNELPLSQGSARAHLARFLFLGDDVFKEMSALSGGERSRLELALLFLLPANLLLLDEPTNHLDIPAREALEAFLASTDATILVVSHDRRLLEMVCNTLWVVDDGLAVPFDGGYRAWRSAVADGWTVKAAAESEARRLHGGHTPAPGARKPGVAVGGRTHGDGARPGGGVVPSAAPGASAPVAERPPVQKLSKDAYRRRKIQLDDELHRLAERKRQLESALQDPGVHGNFLELRRVSGELASVDQALAAAEQAWLEMEEAAP